MWGIAFVVLSVMCGAEPTTDLLKIELEAQATGSGAAGRMAALERAKRAAVERIVKELAARPDTRPFKPLLDRASLYVSSCEIVEQTQQGAETEVKVEAYVREKALRRDLAALLLPLFPRPPKVVVLLSTPQPEDASLLSEEFDAEQQLVSAFEEAGIEVVSPQTVRERCSPAVIDERLHGDPTLAVRFARETLADAVVVGEATVTADTPPKNSNLIPNRANVTLRIIRAEDAKIADMLSAEAVVNSRDTAAGSLMAVSDACAKLKHDALVSTVLAVAGGKASECLVLTVMGVQDTDQWKTLCETLQGEPGVQEVEELYFGEGNGRLRVKYDGEVAPLVDRLAEERFGGFRLEARQVVDRDLTLAVVK